MLILYLFHIFNRPVILLMFILKLFVYTFVNVLKREVNIISLLNEVITGLDLYMIILRRKQMEKVTR